MEYNDGVRVLEGVLQECGPSWLRGLIGSRLQQGFKSWMQELKDGPREMGQTEPADEGAAEEGGDSATLN